MLTSYHYHNLLILITISPKTPNIGSLDYEISFEEIKFGAYILRNGKVAGYDRISNEMLSCLLNTSQEIIKKLFNAILRNPKVLTMWNISLISPIYKKGSKTKPENYIGIYLLTGIGKFFTSILNQRLLIFVSEMRILSKSQLGFVPGNRTSDALITLHIVIDYYCKKPKQNEFGCFVDFQTAFDKVPRFTLVQKILDHNINGKFYDCLIVYDVIFGVVLDAKLSIVISFSFCALLTSPIIGHQV